MINRLLDRIDSPRRHLAVLMSLLSITFVLTGLLAWQAHRSERAEQNVKLETLDEIARVGVTTFSAQFAYAASEAAPWRNNRAVHAFASDPAIALPELIELSNMRSLCATCTDAVVRLPAFLMDLSTGEAQWWGTVPNEAVARHVTALVRAGKVAAPFADTVSYGYYSVPDPTHPLVFAFIRHTGEKPHRIFAALLDSATVRAMVHKTVENHRVYPTAPVKLLRSDSLLAIRMTGAGVQVFFNGDATDQGVVRDIAMAPLYGAEFEVNVRASAAQALFPQRTTAEWPLLAVLVALISMLFIASLLLVRREAELAHLRADFIASASHELRTPLAQIRMFTETLLLGRVRSDTERRRSLEIVDQEARRLSNLVENLLAFSRNEGGRAVRIAPEPTHFADEIRHAIESFGPMARTSSVDMRAELQENVSAAVDRNALRQILVNLLDNALKYGPTGQRVTVGLALFDDAARIWVDDEGPGIPQADRERVFESFYRMRRDIDARITGSGIGLAVVRQLAGLHAGEAWAEAAPGGGARIVVQFPGAYLRQANAADLAAAS